MPDPVGIIEYTGAIVSSAFQSGPWEFYGFSIPDYGAIPYRPCYETEVLQPPNVDGARYRLGGAHFPMFRMITLCAAADYTQASQIARDHEICRSDRIRVTIYNDKNTPRTCAVISCRSNPNAKRILSAFSTTVFGGAGTTMAGASVDTEWMLQVVSE